MNLTMTTQWSKNNHRTFLIVNVSAENTSGSTASQTYLDIQLPEGVRIRHIGNLPTDGHGNNIGVDIPDLAAGEHQNIVFKVKIRNQGDDAITPELHLHWIDTNSGDLLERHQTGGPIPTEQTEANEELAEIVAAARSENVNTRPTFHRRETNLENESMHTDRNTEARHNRHSHRCGSRRGAFEAGRELGRRGGRMARKRAMMLHIQEMHERIDVMEKRISQLQGKHHFRGMPHIEERETEREVARTCHGMGHSDHHGRHPMHDTGRRMGRMMKRSWQDRHLDA